MGKDARKRRERNDRGDGQPFQDHRSEPIVAGMWAVAFLDLMGYREELLATDHFPDLSDPDRETKMAALFKRPINRRESLIEGARKFISAATTRRPDRRPNALSPELRALLEYSRRVVIRNTGFSDSLFLESALAPISTHFPVAAILDIVLACATTIALHLSGGSPVRGGIDVAPGLKKDGHIYTAATVKAVALEKCAAYPRILVGEEFRRYLESFGQPPDHAEPRPKLEAAIAQTIQRLLYKDPDDGLWAVDFLGSEVRERFGTAMSPEMVQQISAFARKAKAEFDGKGRQKEAGYYERLIRYVDLRLPVWETTPTA